MIKILFFSDGFDMDSGVDCRILLDSTDADFLDVETLIFPGEAPERRLKKP